MGILRSVHDAGVFIGEGGVALETESDASIDNRVSGEAVR
jgi:hypothetical protein